MLLRMYARWAEREGFDIELDYVMRGRRGRASSSAEFTLTGRYAYGLMTSERGTHRLVRISPFDNQGRRQTSFAAVQVWPVMDAPTSRSTTPTSAWRSSGLGRRRPARQQDVVGRAPDPRADRLVASSQEERSQLQNREKAMGRLKAMLAAKIEEEHQAELDAIAGKQAQVGWGSQIRSYVVQPYQMVKDLRTESRRATWRQCSTATSTSSWRATSAGKGQSRPRSDGFAVSISVERAN